MARNDLIQCHSDAHQYCYVHGLFVLANCYTLAGFIFLGGSDHINWEFIMWAYEGRVYP